MKRAANDILSQLEAKSKKNDGEDVKEEEKRMSKRRLGIWQNLDTLLSSSSVASSVALGEKESEEVQKRQHLEGIKRSTTDSSPEVKGGENKEDYFTRILSAESKEDIYSEYQMFLKRLPPLTQSQRVQILSKVRKELKIDDIEATLKVDTKRLKSLSPLPDSGRKTPIMDALSIKLGISLNILVPPTTRCLLCYRELTFHNECTQVPVFTLTGPMMFSKYIWRCRKCRGHGNLKRGASLIGDVYYHPDRYGNSVVGHKFYPQNMNIEVT